MVSRGDEAGQIGAMRGALLIGISYMLISALYIVTSGYIVQAIAADIEELARLERYKGLVFVAMTSLYLGALAHWLLSRLWEQSQALARQREALLRAEHRATSGTLASSLAHDFNNVLVALSLGIDELEHADDQEVLIAELKQAVAQGHDMTSKLLARMRERGLSRLVLAAMDACLLAQEAVELTRPIARQRQVELSCDLPKEAMMRGDADSLRRAVANLLVNAVDAADEGKVCLIVNQSQEWLSFEVHDDGPGFSEATLKRLTEPFYTTKPAGTGLGLFSARFCAEQHHGRLELDRSERLGGACARLMVPISVPRATA